jgi:hypothetical protein
VGAENVVTSCDLHVLVQETAEPVASEGMGAENSVTSCDLQVLVNECHETLKPVGFQNLALGAELRF